MNGNVLVLSAKRKLLALRAAVLRAGGFRVDTAEPGADAVQLLRTHNYDALVICSSVPEQSGAEYAALLRERNPKACVVFVGRTVWQRPSTFHADSFISGADGAEAMISAVKC